MPNKYNLKQISVQKGEGLKAVAIGDSVTYGMSASDNSKCWVSLLEGMLNRFGIKAQILNKGISGNILSIESPAYKYSSKPVGLERLDTDITEQNPDMVIIAYGLNDSRGGTSPVVFKRDYQAMIDHLREKGNPIIVSLSLYYMHEEFYKTCEDWDHSDYELTDEYNLIIRQLAEKNGLIYADIYAAQQGVDWAVCDDHCHPNDLGHFMIANRVFEAIARNCEI